MNDTEICMPLSQEWHANLWNIPYSFLMEDRKGVDLDVKVGREELGVEEGIYHNQDILYGK